MKYYTETIPVALAEKLKEKGMPLGSYVWMPNGMASRKDEANLAYFDDQLISYCTYAEVYDWLMGRGLSVNILGYNNEWRGAIHVPSGCFYASIKNTWHEAANAVIERALELI